jgi:hypothetical protein
MEENVFRSVPVPRPMAASVRRTQGYLFGFAPVPIPSLHTLLGPEAMMSASSDSASWWLFAARTHESRSLLKNRRVSSLCAACARSTQIAARLQASSALDMA